MVSSSQSLPQRPPHTPITHWASVWAGVVIALGILALVFAAGMGGSAASIDVQNDTWWRGPLALAGISSAVALLTALFVGGFVAAWGAGVQGRSDGVLQGATAWGVVTLLLTWLLVGAATSAVTGALHAASSGAQALGEGLAKSGDALGDMGKSIGEAGAKVAGETAFDADTLLKPVNDKLKREGREPVRAQQVESAVRSLAKQASRDGKLERQTLIDTIVKETSISRADAEGVAEQVEGKIEEMRQAAQGRIDAARDTLDQFQQEAKNRVKDHADDVAAGVAKSFSGLFIALLVSLGTAIGGGATAAALRAKASG